MNVSTSGLNSLASAAIRAEFDESGFDRGVIDDILRGEVDDCITQLEMTGLFTDLEREYLRVEWRRDPTLLLGALIEDDGNAAGRDFGRGLEAAG